MRVAITGVSGFIGRHLSAALRDSGYEIRSVSTRDGIRASDFDACDAVVHLAGEPVAQRWTRDVCERIRSSRVEGTRAVVAAAAGAQVLVSASAIGYYGSRGDELLTESSAPGSDFLSRVAVEWEHEADRFPGRVVKLRISMVLGRGGGALQKMLPPFRLGIGGRIGDGSQWTSWIHIADLVSLIVFALENPKVSGAINASSPEPVTNAEFTRALARALHRPAIFPVPEFALKLLFGEMSAIVLASQRVIPQAARDAGFAFRFPEISTALRELL
ncbi:MAG TPA: TIGR01777 family oxidoreductase [Bryobacteraceae bacterium]|nr:TIGR01777 family oxidoreductase [Bryobacteraceae bacterium]